MNEAREKRKTGKCANRVVGKVGSAKCATRDGKECSELDCLDDVVYEERISGNYQKGRNQSRRF